MAPTHPGIFDENADMSHTLYGRCHANVAKMHGFQSARSDRRCKKWIAQVPVPILVAHHISDAGDRRPGKSTANVLRSTEKIRLKPSIDTVINALVYVTWRRCNSISCMVDRDMPPKFQGDPRQPDLHNRHHVDYLKSLVRRMPQSNSPGEIQTAVAAGGQQT